MPKPLTPDVLVYDIVTAGDPQIAPGGEVIPWLDQQLRRAGRPDLTQWDLRPGVGLVSAATVGAVLASRRPRHPVGWLLLAQVAANLATGAAAQYLAWGTLRGELLAVVDQTMQPTQASLWLRPSPALASAAGGRTARQ